jgi:hypothetical protein
MRCPVCDRRFVPWRVCAVSRWTCIRCPHCRAPLNREVNLQLLVVCAVTAFGAVALLYAIFPPPLWPFPWPALPPTQSAAAATVLIVTAYLLDVLTVRLVPAGQWRGWLGYETDPSAPL